MNPIQELCAKVCTDLYADPAWNGHYRAAAFACAAAIRALPQSEIDKAAGETAAGDIKWLHRFINCVPFGERCPAEDMTRAHEIVSALVVLLATAQDAKRKADHERDDMLEQLRMARIIKNNPCEKHIDVEADGYCPICLIENAAAPAALPITDHAGHVCPTCGNPYAAALPEEAVRLLREVMAEHANPDDAFYNECDKGLCGWCDAAAALLSAQGERK